ncbi:hypothetical protein [Microbacterium imperiale]|uniref:hypothetical protein n=1 Tax=Microbacterium imperiale TaxID=33884 RepID=UPI0022F27540|nr:hypothetical protein [Microbacterium imperiale]
MIVIEALISSPVAADEIEPKLATPIAAAAIAPPMTRAAVLRPAEAGRASVSVAFCVMITPFAQTSSSAGSN